MTMTKIARRDRHHNLSVPAPTSWIDLAGIDADTFGAVSERVARFFGTARFLGIQTVIVAVWIALNITAASIRWDPYPFILLNLAFSTQAAYAAPFILLAQNRQADRDRVQIAEDRAVDARQRATTDYLAVELAGVRLAQNDAATRDYIDRVLTRELGQLRRDLIAEIRSARTDALSQQSAGDGEQPAPVPRHTASAPLTGYAPTGAQTPDADQGHLP